MDALMIEAENTSETSVNFYQITRRSIQEDSHLHTRRRENLKSYLNNFNLARSDSITFAPAILSSAHQLHVLLSAYNFTQY
jgi:hypothetical protein